jgi:hypothetical protein
MDTVDTDIDLLDNEIKYFEQIKDQLLQTNRGQYALIKNGTLFGTFKTFRDAYNAGALRFQDESFLIRHIVEEESPQSIPAYTNTLVRGSF